MSGTYRATAGPGCGPFLNPRPAAFFPVDRRGLLHPFGGAVILGPRHGGKRTPPCGQTHAVGELRTRTGRRLWGIRLCLPCVQMVQ